MSKLDDFEAEELIRGIFNLSDDADIFDVLADEFDIDFDQWRVIAGTLIAFTPIVESPITKTKYHAFIKDGIALAKVKAEDIYQDQERGE